MNLNKILKSKQAYFKWRVERIKKIGKYFPEIFNVKGKKVLDIGCGAEAPLAYYLSEIKHAKVYAGEIDSETLGSAKKFAKKAKIVLFYSEQIPFKDNEFDVVYLWDVLEHVQNPLLAIKEAKRVVKKNGLIFVKFAPYYSYPTGHHLYPLGFPRGFLPFQFLPNDITKKIVLSSKVKIKNTPRYMLEQFELLNKLSVIQFKKTIKKTNLKLIKEKSFIALPDSEISISFLSKIPFLNEIITMSYCGLLKK